MRLPNAQGDSIENIYGIKNNNQSIQQKCIMYYLLLPATIKTNNITISILGKSTFTS